MADDIKRLNYFTNQFLEQTDFQAEQSYHRRMRYLHNQRLHTPGVAYGLAVSRKGDREVTIAEGMAVDADGREIVVLEGGLSYTLTTTELNTSIYLSIAASDVDVDSYKVLGYTDKFTRKAERPKFLETAVVTPNAVVLAILRLDPTGKIAEVNTAPVERRIVTAAIAPNAIGTTQLANLSVTTEKLVDNAITAAKIQDGAVNTAELADGSVTVDKLANDSVNAAKIQDGSVSTAKLADSSVSESKLALPLQAKLTDFQQSQWRHNQNLHTFGIAGDGLVVRFANNQTSTPWTEGLTSIDLTITAGMALAPNGRDILVPSTITYTLNLPQPSNRDSYVSLQTYLVLRLDSASQQGVIEENTAPPQDGSVIVLAFVTGSYLSIMGGGSLGIAESVRQMASARVSNVKQKVSITVDSAQHQLCLQIISTMNRSQTDLSSAGSSGINNYVYASSPQQYASSNGIIHNVSASGKTGAESVGVSASASASASDPNASITSYGIQASASAYSSQSSPNAYAYGVYAYASGSPNAKVYGIYAAAGDPALYVNGKAVITGGVRASHITDRFINGSGQRLRTGDVVKLKGTPVARFTGENSKVPVTEVTLADRENDPKVIGIVDGEALPEHDAPDMRTAADDPTFIEDGGDLDLVILGVYAHCKVDATDAPIEVGDLLTSSNNPGHAKKATNPQLGSIIGKALEPLAQGTGYIAVFVNIQ